MVSHLAYLNFISLPVRKSYTLTNMQTNSVSSKNVSVLD